MTTPSSAQLSPLRDRQHLARLGLHSGPARLTIDGETVMGEAEFLLPVDGDCVIAFLAAGGRRLSRRWPGQIFMEGTSADGPFETSELPCFVHGRRSVDAEGRWVFVTTMNQPLGVSYGSATTAVRAVVTLNNFDYEDGDVVTDEAGGMSTGGGPLRVSADGRPIEFRWRRDRDRLLPQLRARVLHSSSLTEFSFKINDGEADAELVRFATDVAALCVFAAGQLTNVTLMELLDDQGRIVRRLVPNPIKSAFGPHAILDDHDVPRLFSECFVRHRQMRESTTPWKKLSSYCGCVEDAPFLEQRFSSLATALEFVMRNGLRDAGVAEGRLGDLSSMIGAARRTPGWSVPDHYTRRDAIRLLRNAVIHGDDPPTRDSREFRAMFDKWRLFLFRRALIQLGFQGEVLSPRWGVWGGSAVDDFSEETNSFVGGRE